MIHNQIVFENKGLIDVRAIKTFGVSVKDSKNPFGQFGTGLKYSIGILLREKQEIVIYVGLEKFEFGLVSTTIRGETFDIVTMNGEELGFTSKIGKNWELWMAYRELYCNVMDEGGTSRVAPWKVIPEERKTKIIVTGKEFYDVHLQKRSFLLQTPVLESLNYLDIHDGESSSVFYQGICVLQLPKDKKTRLTYNLTRGTTLTEDRTLKSLFDLTWAIGRSIGISENEETIRKAVTAMNYLEADVDLANVGKPSPQFMKVMKELTSDYGTKIIPSARELFKRHLKKDLTPKSIELTVVQKKQLEKSINFCNNIGFSVNDYEIIVTKNLGKRILGIAKGGKIYLAEETFEMGTKMVAGTLIEEYIHIRYGYDDNTRSMQNFLFNKIVSLGEDIMGEPL